jgi:hypothetical protein
MVGYLENLDSFGTFGSFSLIARDVSNVQSAFPFDFDGAAL